MLLRGDDARLAEAAWLGVEAYQIQVDPRGCISGNGDVQGIKVAGPAPAREYHSSFHYFTHGLTDLRATAWID